jgi:fructose-1,6-bisphosphatase II
MDRNLGLDLLRATEAAALACARHIGGGDPQAADEVAIRAMHEELAEIDMAGHVMVGEGEADEAPRLYLGETIGTGNGPRVELAVDALEGATLVATGGPNAISAIAVAEEGGFLEVPDTYMDKIAVGPAARGAIDIDRGVPENLQAVAQANNVPVEDLFVVILDRPRHEPLIEEVRKVGSRIKLIKHGDLSAALATCGRTPGVDVLLGVGGAREGGLAAAALRCCGGDMQARLQPRNREEADAARALGLENLDRALRLDDLATGQLIFVATGVTSGDFLQGVQYRAEGSLTHSTVMRSETSVTRWIEAEHNARAADQ